MMLIEQTTVATASLPVDAFKEHLRLGTGFADDALQDTVLETSLRAAMAAIEARTGKVLITRTFLWSLSAWRTRGKQALPVAPVQSITGVIVVDRDGVETVYDSESYGLAKDDQRPSIVAFSGCLPASALGGSAEITFEAGFGATWAAIPADLAQAVYLLAAHYYEHRHATATRDDHMPFGVSSLIERYRTVRLLGGGAK
jgi:uncharacterized phiE125 gp8 family phage protein